MGRHSEWRKIAKRERRRRIRTQLAKERDGADHIESDVYKNWLEEQQLLDQFELEQIEKINMEENDKWVKAEKLALEQWRKLLEHREKLRIQRLEEEAKIQLEWEQEQENKRKEEERLKEIEEENKRKQELFMQHLEKFLSGDSSKPPDELLVSRETKPDSNLCPFFSKTACCRFGDQCSRNHRYPGVSKVLLATNFFSHFGLEKADEHDVDIMLEYTDSDTYKEFTEFFNDVLPEFEKFGRITQFKVCNNYEKHLRGNTYVEFAELRCAVAAYRALHTRWYGGKQLSLQFCFISSWKNAICGLQSRKRCPKGRSCNFMHVFKNPNNLFNSIRENYEHSERSHRTPPRSWRWSESPEVDVSRRRRSRSTDRRERRREERHSRDDTSRGKGGRNKRESSQRDDRSRDDASCEYSRRVKSWSEYSRRARNKRTDSSHQRKKRNDPEREVKSRGRDEFERDSSPRGDESRKESRHKRNNKESPELSPKRRKSCDRRSHRGSS